MPKIKQVIPTEVIDSFAEKRPSSQHNNGPRPRENPKIYSKGEAKPMPPVENVTLQQSAYRGKQQYFQQYPGTKRFVDAFLRKRRAEEKIQSELLQISIELGLPEQSTEVYSIGQSIPVGSQPRATLTRPKSASTSTRKFDVHHGASTRDFSEEDIKYFSGRFFTDKLEEGTTTVQRNPNGNSSPDKLFDENKAMRKKKRPHTAALTKQEIAIVRDVAFPEWINIRENTLEKVESVVARILAQGNDKERIAPMRQEFLSLLTVVQHTTLKVVEFYADHHEEFERKLHGASRMDRHDEAWQATMRKWKEWKAYMEGIPTSLNWLEENPFRLWSGIHFAMNPLMACYDLYNELATMMNEGLHEVIRSTNCNLFTIRSSIHISNPALVDDLAQQILRLHQISAPISDLAPVYTPDVIRAMAKELRYEEAFHNRLVRASLILRDVHESNKSHMQSMKTHLDTQRQQQELENMVSPNMAHYNRLSFLVYGSPKLQELEQKSQIVRSKTQVFNTRHYFHLWQRCKFCEISVRYMLKRRKLRIFHWVMSGLHASKVQKHRLEALRERVLRSQLHVLLDRWKANLHWWKRFDTIYFRCNRDRMQFAIDRWQQFLEEKQQWRVECLLPVLEPEYIRETTKDVTSMLERGHELESNSSSSLMPFSVLKWIRNKAFQQLSSSNKPPPPSELPSSPFALASSMPPFSPQRRPHHIAEDDLLFPVDEEAMPPAAEDRLAKGKVDPVDEQSRATLDSETRRKLRAAEAHVTERVARTQLMQQRAFRAWRKAYNQQRLVHRMCFIMKDYQVWAAWRQWRAAMKELRFESKIEKRRQELLREVYDGQPPPLEARPSQRSWVMSRSMSMTMDEGDVDSVSSSNQGSLLKRSSPPGIIPETELRYDGDFSNTFSPVVSPTRATMVSPTLPMRPVRQSQVAFSLKDVPIIYRRKLRVSNEETENEERSARSSSGADDEHTASANTAGDGVGDSAETKATDVGGAGSRENVGKVEKVTESSDESALATVDGEIVVEHATVGAVTENEPADLAINEHTATPNVVEAKSTSPSMDNSHEESVSYRQDEPIVAAVDESGCSNSPENFDNPNGFPESGGAAKQLAAHKYVVDMLESSLLSLTSRLCVTPNHHRKGLSAGQAVPDEVSFDVVDHMAKQFVDETIESSIVSVLTRL